MDDKYSHEIKSFGGRLREIRKRKNLTQLQLEVLCGMDRTEISKIENGLKNIEFFTIIKLALALKIEPGDLFDNKQASTQPEKGRLKPRKK